MATLANVKGFWEAHVNNEYYTSRGRGSEEYFAEIRQRRYKHHYHLVDLFREMKIDKPLKLLEIGCGIGIDSLSLAEAGFDVTGCELTGAAVQIASRRSRDNNRVRFVQSNAERLPFDNECFDSIYSFGVIHHTPDMAATVREMHRVLRPGGEARVMIYARHSLVNAIHSLLHLPFESPRNLKDHCPVVIRSSRVEAHGLFSQFRTVSVGSAYPFTYGMRHVARFVPRPVERALGRLVGWHLMIKATK